jgi:hypothetical protein
MTRRRRNSWLTVLVLYIGIGACAKTSSTDSTASQGSSVPAAPSVGTLKTASSASAGATAQTIAWSGSYTAKVGAVEPPKNANEKVWTQDPGSAAIGKGSIDLSVREREARGETKGPLGDMTISGLYDGKELRANLLPKEPRSDGAMTGFLLLTTEGEAMKGILRVSGRDARIVREAAVELAKKGVMP